MPMTPLIVSQFHYTFSNVMMSLKCGPVILNYSAGRDLNLVLEGGGNSSIILNQQERLSSTNKSIGTYGYLNIILFHASVLLFRTITAIYFDWRRTLMRFFF